MSLQHLAELVCSILIVLFALIGWWPKYSAREIRVDNRKRHHIEIGFKTCAPQEKP